MFSPPGLGRSPGEVNGNPLHYSCLENPINKGAWQATVHEVAVGHDLATKKRKKKENYLFKRRNHIFHLFIFSTLPGTCCDYSKEMNHKYLMVMMTTIMTVVTVGRQIILIETTYRDFPDSPVVKNLLCSAGDEGSIPDWGTKMPHTTGQLTKPAGHSGRACMVQQRSCVLPLRPNTAEKKDIYCSSLTSDATVSVC